MISANGFQSPPPDKVLAPNDPGDETARRFRFQYTWAAIVCCMLLDDTCDVVEVFCEHHEDVLIKHRDGKFTGHQVKTRESDQPSWKAGDEQVKKTCSRFVCLEVDFPGHFREFHFLTGHPIHVANNAQSLKYVLAEIATSPTVDALQPKVGTWLRQVARDARATESVAFQALKKMIVSADLPKLQDSSMRLIHALADCWTGAADCTHDSVVRASQSLIDECARASSLNHEQLLPAYVLAIHQPDRSTSARIAGKRMTADRVQAILADGLNSTASLVGEPARRVEPGYGSTDLLQKKT